MNVAPTSVIEALLDPLALITLLGSAALFAGLVYLVFFDGGSEL